MSGCIDEHLALRRPGLSLGARLALAGASYVDRNRVNAGRPKKVAEEAMFFCLPYELHESGLVLNRSHSPLGTWQDLAYTTDFSFFSDMRIPEAAVDRRELLHGGSFFYDGDSRLLPWRGSVASWRRYCQRLLRVLRIIDKDGFVIPPPVDWPQPPPLPVPPPPAPLRYTLDLGPPG